MTLCQHCKRPHQLYLCDDCSTTLWNMLDQIPWLLEQLDARIQKMDRIPHGTIGRTRRPGDADAIDFAACETARATRKTLQKWVEEVAELHNGRTPPGLDTIATKDFARWLQVNIEAIARLDLAKKGRHPLYDDIERMVGSDQRGGQLVGAINRHERHFAGPCPTPKGFGAECGKALFADIDDETVVCPDCGETVNVKENLDKAAVSRDLLPEPKLLEVLRNIGEPVSRVKLYQWIREQRIRPKGFLHQGKVVANRVRRGDAAVYSLARARKLRNREVTKQQLEGQVK